MQYKRISADCHLDMPWMPPELFVSEASNELRDRMPYVTDGPDGPQWVTKNGANFGLLNGVGPSGAKLVPGQNKRVDIMARRGMFEDGKKGIQRVSDPHLRVKEMDRDGVDAEVIFGILGSTSKMQDNEAATPPYRPRLPALRQHRTCRRRNLPLRQNGTARTGTVLLMGHGANVAPLLGTVVAG
ncbi:MAG: hypothetical protein ABSC06_07680, partial [Rhodopila sp.]